MLTFVRLYFMYSLKYYIWHVQYFLILKKQCESTDLCQAGTRRERSQESSSVQLNLKNTEQTSTKLVIFSKYCDRPVAWYK